MSDDGTGKGLGLTVRRSVKDDERGLERSAEKNQIGMK